MSLKRGPEIMDFFIIIFFFVKRFCMNCILIPVSLGWINPSFLVVWLQIILMGLGAGEKGDEERRGKL